MGSFVLEIVNVHVINRFGMPSKKIRLAVQASGWTSAIQNTSKARLLTNITDRYRYKIQNNISLIRSLKAEGVKGRKSSPLRNDGRYRTVGTKKKKRRSRTKEVVLTTVFRTVYLFRVCTANLFLFSF